MLPYHDSKFTILLSKNGITFSNPLSISNSLLNSMTLSFTRNNNPFYALEKHHVCYFDDNASVFLAVHDISISAKSLNGNLIKIESPRSCVKQKNTSSVTSQLVFTHSRPILHLTIEAAPLFENYAKLYFHAKHLEKGLNTGRRGGFLELFFKKAPFFHIKMLSLTNIEFCPKFLEYVLNKIKFFSSKL